MRTHTMTGLAAALALATWPLPFRAYVVVFGVPALAAIALPLAIAAGAVSLALRFHFRRDPAHFGIFFPVIGAQRGTEASVGVIAAFLTIFNVLTFWFISHAAMSRGMMDLAFFAGTYSAMNLADEWWVARRRRLERSG